MSTSQNPSKPSSRHNGEAPDSRANGVIAFLRARPRARRVLLILVGAIAVVAAPAWFFMHGKVSTDDAQVDGHILPVSARVGGSVLTVEVEENRWVDKGTVLIRLDPTDYEVALKKAEADQAAAKATLVAARSGVPITTASSGGQLSTAEAEVRRAKAAASSAEANLAAIRARAREAEANRDKAKLDRERLQSLVAKDEVSRQEYDGAVAAAIAAEANVEAAEADIVQAEQATRQAEDRVAQAEADLRTARTAPEQVEVTRAQVKAAEARLELATAALKQARLALEYTVVRAAVSGVVSKRSVEPGQVVQPGQPLFALVDLEDLWVTANFKETKLKNMAPGQRAKIRVDAYDRVLNGHVDSIGAATGARFSLLPAENASGNFVKVVQRVPVKILIEPDQDPEHKLRPGLSVVPTVYIR